MLTECFNPACRRRLDYLRDGRVIRTVQTATSPMSLEHYWLCGSCYGEFTLSLSPMVQSHSAPGGAQCLPASVHSSITLLDEQQRV
jgi:hypothetical protein